MEKSVWEMGDHRQIKFDALQAVADAARAFALAYEPPDEELLDKTYYALMAALDKLND